MYRNYSALNQGETATAEEIRESINSRVAGYEEIREMIFRTGLPVCLAGKVLKKVLKKKDPAERQG